MRILVVTQMWPSAAEPGFGAFVAQICRALERDGHELEVVAIDRRGLPKTKYVTLFRQARAAARRFKPDVVYAHFLAPAGVIAARASRAPLVLTAHGTDVANLERGAWARAFTRIATRRAYAVIAVSGWLRDRLVGHLPELEGRVEVIDSGVDLELFAPRDQEAARAQVGWDGEGPRFLFVGTLDGRKRAEALADAFEGLGRGSLAFVGDGPVRERLEGREDIRVVGRLPHEQVADWIAACDYLCQPTDGEAFGQAILEAMASERSVLATTRGGPPEFVTPEAGVLVDPREEGAIERGLRALVELPSPNPAARTAATLHDVRVQAGRVAEILRSA